MKSCADCISLQIGCQAQLCEGSQGDLREHQEESQEGQEASGQGVVLQAQGSG